LQANNHRDWFAANKARYQAANDNFKAFAQALQNEMSQYDELESVHLHRIYRDVRFSKDKTPYSNRLSGSFVRATKWRRGGYYFHVEPGDAFAGGGFWAPEAADLKRIRAEIAADPQPLRNILAAAPFVETFGQMEGEQLKSAPAGYPKDHPAIDLLRYKQYLLLHRFTDAQVLAPDFVQQMAHAFRQMIPFFDYMSDVLTTDENGVPIE
jgi:uncharacterized protein (TIGR02453 family)